MEQEEIEIIRCSLILALQKYKSEEEIIKKILNKLDLKEKGNE